MEVDGDDISVGSDALWLIYETDGESVGFLIVPTTLTTPTISISDLTYSEGDSGSSSMLITVSLSAGSASTITVDYATSNGTAVAGSDFTAVSGTLTFLPWETSQMIDVPILGDMTYELDEDFFINLGAATNASIADGVARGLIENDDSPPTIMIYVTGVAEGDSGTTLLTFTISLSGLSALPVTVDYATSDAPYDSATAGTDYQATSGTLTFNPGQTEKVVHVVVYGDTDWENDEWVLLDLFNAV